MQASNLVWLVDLSVPASRHWQRSSQRAFLLPFWKLTL